jgi:predicted dehydrogenase
MMKDLDHIARLQLPIYIIGAGGIVNDAHLPAYQKAGFRVQGITDLDPAKARATAARWDIPEVFLSIEEMIAVLPADAVVDIAVPAPALADILERLPNGIPVLFQKPMGADLSEARRILGICRDRQLLAAVNFQLRYAPFILEVKRMITEGLLGRLYDVEVNVNVYTPWHLWDFLSVSPRVEILYHSIHYVDLVRHLIGEPASVHAHTNKHPSMPHLASVRSSIIMDYGDMVRANILTNHCHDFGTPNQYSYIKIEGDRGAVIIHFGALIDYPRGAPDRFSFTTIEDGVVQPWQTIEIPGSWFPDAFIGPMASLMQAAVGIVDLPDNTVEDCIHTMACVEAAYDSSRQGGVRPAHDFGR